MELKKIKNAALKLKATIIISLLILSFYLFLSQGEFFIPKEKIMGLSFNLWAPHNALFFTFIHTGYAHLLVNIVSFIAFAVIVELLLGSFDVIAIFFIAQISASALFLLLNPGKALIGASAGVSGLLAAAFVLRPVRAIIAIVLAFLILLLFFIPFMDFSFLSYREKISGQVSEIKEDLNDAISSGDFNTAYDLNRGLQNAETAIERADEGAEFQQETPTDFWIHGYGAVAGLLYLYIFRRKKLLGRIKEFSSSVKGAMPRIGGYSK